MGRYPDAPITPCSCRCTDRFSYGADPEIPPPYLIEGPFAVVDTQVYFPPINDKRLPDCVSAAASEQCFQLTHRPCRTCFRSHNYSDKTEPLAFGLLNMPPCTEWPSVFTTAGLLNSCRMADRGKQNEQHFIGILWTTRYRFLSRWSKAVREGGITALLKPQRPPSIPTFFIESPLTNGSASEGEHQDDSFATNSGATISWAHLMKVMQHVREDRVRLDAPTLFGTWERPNHNGTSQWHSSITLFVLENRTILREEKSIIYTGASGPSCWSEYLVLPHYTNYELRRTSRTLFFKESWRDVHDCWAKEYACRCQECGTEFALLYRNGQGFSGPNIFVWRYVDLGDLNGPDAAQWTRVTKEVTKKIKLVQPRYEWSDNSYPPLDYPSTIDGVYGPLMKLWCESLGIVYHYDRDVVPWLSQSGYGELERKDNFGPLLS